MLKPLNSIKDKSKQLLLHTRENNLIFQFLTKDANLFPEFYSRYHKPIYKFVCKYVCQSHVAEEITQDIFLKIHQHRHTYNPTFKASTWVWTVAKNTIYDHLRHFKANPVSLPLMETVNDNSWEPMISDTAESLIIEELEKRKLLDLMASLSTKQKEAILLRMVNKFSYQEISRSMNLSLSAVKSLISRGKASLQKLHHGISEHLIPESKPGEDLNIPEISK